MTEAPSVCICGKCGATLPLFAARLRGWLVRERVGVPAGHWLVRCPAHITRRARAAVGLPERVSVARVRRFVKRGFWVEVDGVHYFALHDEYTDFTESLCLGVRGQPGSTRWFSTTEALALAMSEVADLRKWKVADE